MEKITAFTDSEYTYLHELDLEVIKEMQTVAIKQENDFVTYVNVEYCVSVAKQVPALIAEVERLREEVLRAKPVYVDIAVLQEAYERLETENDKLREENEKIMRRLKASRDVNSFLKERLSVEEDAFDSSNIALGNAQEENAELAEENKRLRKALQTVKSACFGIETNFEIAEIARKALDDVSNNTKSSNE